MADTVAGVVSAQVLQGLCSAPCTALTASVLGPQCSLCSIRMCSVPEGAAGGSCLSLCLHRPNAKHLGDKLLLENKMPMLTCAMDFLV